MNRAYALLALSATLAGCGGPELLCRRPEVLQQVQSIIEARNTYNEIDDSTIREAPTTRANAVVCHAAISTIGYVPTETGWQPWHIRAERRYDVQVEGALVHVQVPPGQP